jgi:hypothetical protein
MKKCFAIAQINIPIEITSDGEWINHNDRIAVQIIKTDKLPPISSIENDEIYQTIQELLEGGGNSSEETIEKISVMLNEDEPLPFIISNPPTPPSPPTPQCLYVSSRENRNNRSFKKTPLRSHNKSRSNRFSLR